MKDDERASLRESAVADILQCAPADVDAKELRRLVEKAFARGWNECVASIKRELQRSR